MDLRKKLIKNNVKASLTVEASIVMVMTIMVLGLIISLWIYKFQECWYTQTVSECLLTGSNKAVLNQERYLNDVKLKWEKVVKENYLVPQDLTVQIDGDEDSICIKVNGKTFIWGYSPLQMNVKQEIEIVKPVAYIHKMAAIREVAKR